MAVIREAATCFAKHSLAMRPVQLRETLSAMADGSLAGGRWKDGEYTVTRNEKGMTAHLKLSLPG